MTLEEVESVLVQSDIMEFIPAQGKDEALARALKSKQFHKPDMDPGLPYIFKKHMGWNGNYPPYNTYNAERD